MWGHYSCLQITTFFRSLMCVRNMRRNRSELVVRHETLYAVLLHILNVLCLVMNGNMECVSGFGWDL
jgi:hypothetical protein